jgi:hypothetical protein
MARRWRRSGTGHLLERATTATIVQEGLKQFMPVAPRAANIVIGGADLWSFKWPAVLV